MNNKLPILFGAVGLALATATPAVSAPLSANAAVTTNYVFRGISQSAAQSAVSAGLDYDLGSVLPGLAVGTWASSIDFGHVNGEDTPMELDLYGSYTGTIVDKFTWSVGAITYNYPNSPHGVNYNWYEGWAGLAYDFGVAQVSGKIFYSPDYVNLSTSEWYYTGGITVPIVSWLALSANVGRTELDHAVTPIIKAYTDWNVSLAATFDAYTVTVGYASTDLDGVFEVNHGPFETDDQLWVSIGFKLP
jgi:uncharacterized protein (TIGR02001 family)